MILSGVFIFLSGFSQQKSRPALTDSLFVQLQIKTLNDTTQNRQELVSQLFKEVTLNVEDEYVVTRNFYLLDYFLLRANDSISRSILHYWFGRFLYHQALYYSSLDILQTGFVEAPVFLKPNFQLLMGMNDYQTGAYTEAISTLSPLNTVNDIADSTLWEANKFMAFSFADLKDYANEIRAWESALVVARKADRFDWMILANRSLALAFKNLERYETAISYLNRAYDIHLQTAPEDPEIFQYFVDIALIFERMGNSKKAIGYLKKAAKEMKSAGNEKAEAMIDIRLAKRYRNAGQIDKARETINVALKSGKRSKDDDVLLRAYEEASLIEEEAGNLPNALSNLRNYQLISEKLEQENQKNLDALWIKQYEIERAEKEFTLSIANQELKEIELNQLRLEKAKAAADLEVIRQQKESAAIQLQNERLLSAEARQKLNLERAQHKSKQQAYEIENLKKDQRISELIIKNQTAKEREDKTTIDVLKKDNEIARLNLERQRHFKNRARWIGSLILIIAILLTYALRNEVKNRRAIAQSREIIKDEKRKTDDLLLNILPKETADQLKSTGKALPQSYDQVSIMFTDFCGFTRLTENMNPKDVLNNLEVMFSQFDHIVEQCGMERIKTIGDGYMCAGGIPIADSDNALNAVRAGLMFLKAANDFNQKQKSKGRAPWNLRIGINTGPVVAGVIGKKKFAYDIWGDAVNLASRAESYGLENKLNITENTYLKVKDQFDCEFRGSIEVKNFGEVKMYVVNEALT